MTSSGTTCTKRLVALIVGVLSITPHALSFLMSPHAPLPSTSRRSCLGALVRMTASRSNSDSQPPTDPLPFASSLPLQTSPPATRNKKQEEISGVDGGERSTSEGRGSKRRQREKRSRKAVAPRRFFDVADELAREVEEEFGPGIVTGGSSSSTSSGGRMEGDLLGDGGVIKTIIKAGEGPMVVPGSRVTVNYKGQTQEGQMVFCGGQDYKFQANDGSMVSGWDVALTTMRVGEKARVVVAPRYGYGSKGVPPVIGPDTSLEFEVEVLSLDKAFAPTNFRELDPTNTRDIQSITQDYDRRTALRMRNEEGKSMMDKTQDWFKSLYFFGFFEGATGERPPWYLTPTLTFPFMFALVAAAFYVLASNGGISLKRDAKGIQDDLEMGAALLDHIWG